MPYNARLKTGEPRKRKKPGYRVTNAREYSQSLKKRGQLSPYCPDGDLKALFINAQPYVKGVSGREATYTDAYIELIYTFYWLFGWGTRPITGQMEEFWAIRGLDIAVPSFGHRVTEAALKIIIRQRLWAASSQSGQWRSRESDRPEHGHAVGPASEWHEQKYGRKAAHTPWRKVNLSIDPDMNVHAVSVTETAVSDTEAMDAVLAVDCPVDRVIADGAYYSIEKTETWSACGVLPVIPPPAHAVIHGESHTRWHDRVVGYINKKGSVYAFNKKYGYGLRSRVEAQISRIKRCIGSRLLTRKPDSQPREGVIIANLGNLWNSFGILTSVKIA
ncbi:transposase [Paraburkholderia sediminicola]|uniref:transposase n=1 Tax=Paraburkholderia sediminicola TaxID=458836 RepID=UPI0038BD2696